MSATVLRLPVSLDTFHAALEAAGAASDVTLDFLMQTWNGRFGTWNVGRPVEQPDEADPRRGVWGEARHYKLIGRVKATTQGDALHVTLSPPSACDANPTSEDEGLWRRFVEALEQQVGIRDGG